MTIFKIIIINLIILFTIYIITDIYYYNKLKNLDNNVSLPFFERESGNYAECYPPQRLKPYNDDLKTDKKPVLLLGCSYTYGELLPEDDNLSAKLEKITGRHYYNGGVVGYGPLSSLYFLKKEEQNKLLNKAPELIIYTYMFNHINRVFYWELYNFMRKLGFIPNQKYSLLYKSHVYKWLQNVKADEYFYDDVNSEKKYNLLINIFKEMKKESEKLYPGSKFAVLIYSDINYDLCEGLMGENNGNAEDVERQFKIMESERFKKDLENLGIIVVTTEELIGRKMDKPSDRIKNDPNHPHPSSKAWDEIIPKLVKYFNL